MISCRLQAKAGLVSGFADVEMQLSTPSDGVDVKTVAALISFDRTLGFTARREVALHGSVGSWSAILHGDVVLACDPAGPHVEWPPLLFRLPAGLPVHAGDRITPHFTKKHRPGWSWTWQAKVSGYGRPAPLR